MVLSSNIMVIYHGLKHVNDHMITSEIPFAIRAVFWFVNYGFRVTINCALSTSLPRKGVAHSPWWTRSGTPKPIINKKKKPVRIFPHQKMSSPSSRPLTKIVKYSPPHPWAAPPLIMSFKVRGVPFFHSFFYFFDMNTGAKNTFLYYAIRESLNFWTYNYVPVVISRASYWPFLHVEHVLKSEI